ncbi:MAG TPA: LPS assembly protein LptD [Caldimonas sp.]|nr:LPS assembly protein LptD [Caldimonas sp.]
MSPAARQGPRSSVRERPRPGATWLATPLAAFTVAALAQPAPSSPASSPAASAASPGAAASAGSAGVELRSADVLQAPPRGDAARQLPIILRAREVRARPDLDATAEGDVEFRRGGTVIHADKLTYEQAEDLARATGHVVVTRDGSVFSGPELQLKIERFEGFFREPTYRFARTGAGGKARLIEFIDDQRAAATDATYSSCTIEDRDGEPVWILKAGQLRIDNEANEGIARDAVLRFYGVPILASPVLSFPLSDERKSGFLPPSFGIDNRSGFQAAIPYYWNIAPNRDATFTMKEAFRRGPSLDSEFRYLEPSFVGSLYGSVMPRDAVAERSRSLLRAEHDGVLPLDARVQFRLQRVSDDDYWKDFPGEIKSLTPRLLQTDLLVSRDFGDWTTYARAMRWQILQTEDPTTRIDAPYERAPQIGARYAGPGRFGLLLGLEAEVNRFANPQDRFILERQTGVRTHALGSIARPFVTPGWTLTPQVSFNAASYSLDLPRADGSRSASRIIPTVSLDSAWTLERETELFGRAVRQTLEPRLFYVNTPYKRQEFFPNFDSALKDFNFDSLFTENLFSGVDRVSDSSQLTAGVISRVLDPDTGAEALRVGLAERYRFRDQRITPDNVPLTQRFSDVLAFGSTSLVPRWVFDLGAQFNPDSHRIQRSLAGMRYSPGPYRTVALTYRLSRGLSEQMELGWQWPLYGRARGEGERSQQASSAGCGGTLYTVGHVNYSMRDSRITDSIAGLEYDAGCWIGRVVVERLSTGRSEATTRLLLQLELVGLSRIGSNPLRVLKDNVPGYQLLREERTSTPPFTPYD